MESIINALARAQESVRPSMQPAPPATDAPKLKVNPHVLSLSPEALKANRFVSFDGSDSVTRAFDVLRNTCIKGLVPRVTDRPIFGVTSPNIGSGASTTAVNLAFSLARQQQGRVVLADLALPGQGWWYRLGLEPSEIDTSFQRDTITTIDVNGASIYAANLLTVLAGKSGVDTKEAVRGWAAAVWRDLGPVSIVLDLPPLLSDDRVTSFVSEVDLVLLVLAIGKSTLAEIETCKSYLHDAASVQLVLNKARKYDL